MNESYLNSVKNTALSSKPSTAIRLLLMVLFFSINPLVSFGQTQTFNSSGAFVVPAGVSSITVQAWGAGGGGQEGGNGGGSSAGGGGGYAKSIFVVTPGTTYNYTVGAGGAQNVDGGASSFGTTLLIASGGKSDGSGGTANTGTTTFGGGSGGSNSSNKFKGGAGGGSAAGINNNGNQGSDAAGDTGSNGGAATSGGGAGGKGGNESEKGKDGSSPGGGGGGGGKKGLGGNGGKGQVIISWTCPTYSVTGVSVPTAQCLSSAAVTVNGTPAGLPVGTYTVTYSRNDPWVTGLTATMNVTTAGIGIFTATGLTSADNAGIKITVTNLASGSCSNAIASNNVSNTFVMRAALSTPTLDTGFASCTNYTVQVISQFPRATNYYLDVNTSDAFAAGTYLSGYQDRNLGAAIQHAITGLIPGTKYYYRFRSANVCGTTGNSATDFFTAPGIAVAAIGGGATTVCAGATTPAFTNTTSGGSWSIISGTGTASITSGGVVTGGTPGTVTVVFSVSSSGCTTTATKTLTVNPNLPASVSITALPSGAICLGTSVTFTATPTNGGTSPAYQWYKGATAISGATSATYTSTTLANSDKIKVVMTSNATSCLTGSPATSGSITIIVNSLSTTPTVGKLQPNCKTPTGTITVTSPSPATGITYTVTGTSPVVAGVTNPTGVFSGLAAGDYSVTTTNGSCTSSPTVVVIKPFVEATNTWNGTAWSTGLPPTAEQKLVFAGNYLPAVGQDVDIVGCSCIVTGRTNVAIKSGHTLTITNEVTIVGEGEGAGSLIFENNASLVQINNTAENKGDIEYQRSTSTPVLVTDYVYWSSPVLGLRLGELSKETANGTFYSFDTSTENWNQAYDETLMDIGKGYIVRRPDFSSGIPVKTERYTANFVGEPNNGTINVPSGYSGAVEGTSNLLGNPYPSAIDADKFLKENKNVLDGTLYFWTHNTALNLAGNITNPGPGWAYTYSLDDYASYNITGGVGTASAASDPKHLVDGIDLGNKPTGKIASGQGFFATSKAAGDVKFTNEMRVAGTTNSAGTGVNQQFFKTKNPNAKTANTTERNRVWLNLTNTEGAFKQTLIGYVTDATNDYDNLFDGQSFDGNEYVDFYSVYQDKNLVIQGRALPFDQNDEVPLGYRSTINGDFTINIDQVDGLLANQPVYIEDKLTNTTTDLKSGNYTFNTLAGTFNDRFVLKYASKTLSVDKTDKEDGIMALYSNNYKTLIIRNNMDSTVKSVVLFSMTGQNIDNWNVDDGDQTNIQIPIKNISSGIYIVKVKTSKGESSKKIIVN